MKLTDYKEKTTHKVCVYGPPKTGKTDFVGQLAEGKKLWWFDLDDGIKTLLHSPRMKKEWFDNIEVFSLPDTQLLPIAVDTLLRVIKGGKYDICWKHGACGCNVCKKEAPNDFSSIDVGTFTTNDVLVIDSGSQLASSIMCHISRKELNTLDDKWMNFSPGWDEYKKQGLVSNRIYSILQHAPFNVVVITHEDILKMNDGKTRIAPIGGTSEYSKEFAKFFDHIVYCEIVNKKHVFASSTGYSNSTIVGSRTDKALEKMETPKLLELFK